MKIYFEIPFGYSFPEAHDTEVSFFPRKGDFVEVKKGDGWYVDLRVQKVCFEDNMQKVKVVMVEED